MFALTELRHNKKKIKDILGEAAFLDEDGTGAADAPGASNALDRLTKPSATQALKKALPLPELSSRLVDAVDKGVSRVRTLNSMVEHRVEQTVASVRKNKLLESSDLDVILSHMFVEKPSPSETNPEITSRHELPRCKAAPHGGLLTLLAQYMALVSHRSSGPRAIAHLWSEFVLEVRWHWDNLRQIPRVASADCPDMGACLIYQKLQMINCCIRAKGAKSQGSAKAKSGEDSDSEDEFFLAPEDEQGMMERLERLKQQYKDGVPPTEPETPPPKSATPEPSPPPTPESSGPQGVLEVSSTITLQGSTEPLRIPITQQPRECWNAVFRSLTMEPQLPSQKTFWMSNRTD